MKGGQPPCLSVWHSHYQPGTKITNSECLKDPESCKANRPFFTHLWCSSRKTSWPFGQKLSIQYDAPRVLETAMALKLPNPVTRTCDRRGKRAPCKIRWVTVKGSKPKRSKVYNLSTNATSFGAFQVGLLEYTTHTRRWLDLISFDHHRGVLRATLGYATDAVDQSQPPLRIRPTRLGIAAAKGIVAKCYSARGNA